MTAAILSTVEPCTRTIPDYRTLYREQFGASYFDEKNGAIAVAVATGTTELRRG